jgi:hypothetical protein
MLMGSLVGRWLMTGELVLKKLLVLPVSAMIEESGSGGPTGKLDNAVSIILEVSVVSGFGEVGFPPGQLGAGALRDKDILLLYWSNPVSQVLRAMAFKRTTRGRSNFGELMTAKIS